jgi:hypothetical protein
MRDTREVTRGSKTGAIMASDRFSDLVERMVAGFDTRWSRSLFARMNW